MIDIPATLTLILSGLRAAVGAYMAQRRRTPGVVWLGTHAYTPVVAPQTAFERTIAAIPAETWTLLLTRIGRINGRLHALYHHWRAGTLPKPAPSRPGRPSHAPAPRLPTRQAWVIAAVGYPAAGRAAQLKALMAEPQFVEFITAVPRAARLLRPLCRSLGIAPLPPALALPPRTRPPAIPKPRQPKPPRITLRRPRIPPDFLGLQKPRL